MGFGGPSVGLPVGGSGGTAGNIFDEERDKPGLGEIPTGSPSDITRLEEPKAPAPMNERAFAEPQKAPEEAPAPEIPRAPSFSDTAVQSAPERLRRSKRGRASTYLLSPSGYGGTFSNMLLGS